MQRVVIIPGIPALIEILVIHFMLCPNYLHSSLCIMLDFVNISVLPSFIVVMGGVAICSNLVMINLRRTHKTCREWVHSMPVMMFMFVFFLLVFLFRLCMRCQHLF